MQGKGELRFRSLERRSPGRRSRAAVAGAGKDGAGTRRRMSKAGRAFGEGVWAREDDGGGDAAGPLAGEVAEAVEPIEAAAGTEEEVICPADSRRLFSRAAPAPGQRLPGRDLRAALGAVQSRAPQVRDDGHVPVPRRPLRLEGADLVEHSGGERLALRDVLFHSADIFMSGETARAGAQQRGAKRLLAPEQKAGWLSEQRAADDDRPQLCYAFCICRGARAGWIGGRRVRARFGVSQAQHLSVGRFAAQAQASLV